MIRSGRPQKQRLPSCRRRRQYAEDYLHRVERLVDRQFVTTDSVAEARSRRDATAAAVQEAQRRLRAAEAAVEYDMAAAPGRGSRRRAVAP